MDTRGSTNTEGGEYKYLHEYLADDNKIFINTLLKYE